MKGNNSEEIEMEANNSEEIGAGEKSSDAMDIVKFHSKLAAAGGLVMIPVLDFAAIAGVQVRMIQQLAKHYEVELTDNKSKVIISTLIAGLMPKTIAAGAVGSLIKAIPGIGTLASAFTLPALASTSTYVLGKIFAKHFGEGGSLFDLNKDHLKKIFGAEMKKTEAPSKA